MSIITRFATVDPFFQVHDWDFRMGRPVANAAFGRALLTHGTFDEYRFFLPDNQYRLAFMEHLEKIFPDPKIRTRVTVSTQVELNKVLRDVDFDVFHQGDFTYFMPHLSSLRQWPGTRPFPISGITHSLDGPIMQTRFMQLAISNLKPEDSIICTSSTARELVINKFYEIIGLMNEATGGNLKIPEIKTPIIPLGIEDDLYTGPISAPERKEARNFLNIPHYSIVALSVGRISRNTKSDWSPTLELISRMKINGELDNFILIIAGGGDLKEHTELQNLINRLELNETVLIFLNFPAEVKKILYQVADFYLSLADNYQETFGINIIEAMAAGLPVIASDFDGHRDSVDNGKTGFLVSTTSSIRLPSFLDFGMHILDVDLTRHYLSQMIAIDLDELHGAISLLFRNEDLRNSMGEKGRLKAERYRWKSIIMKYENVWLESSQSIRRQSATTTLEAPTGPSELLSGFGMLSYAHYNSAILGDNTRLGITPIGYNLLKSDDLIIRHETLDPVFSKTLERSILINLSIGILKVSELYGRLVREPNLTIGDLHFHILWLMKHGAIKLNKD